ncbi:hypothetical protein [Streptomyces sp. NPDC016675]|uniref:phosphatase domain-containing protein n=1 Tax=Streptomyces sp. NPDC016675 TaxID=3364970 RepID=UPI0036FC8157
MRRSFEVVATYREPVLMHCGAGTNRKGTMAAAYLHRRAHRHHEPLRRALVLTAFHRTDLLRARPGQESGGADSSPGRRDQPPSGRPLRMLSQP